MLAIVKLDEGPRMTAQIVCRPDEVKIGMRVKSVFRRIATDGESGIIHYGTKFVPVEVIFFRLFSYQRSSKKKSFKENCLVLSTCEFTLYAMVPAGGFPAERISGMRKTFTI